LERIFSLISTCRVSAYVYSNTDNIQANLHYLDYKRLKDGGDTNG
jgi:hypothetical protein